MRFLSSLWSCSFEVMPGTPRNILYIICLSVEPPSRICQQLYWRIHNVFVCPELFLVVVVRALALEAIFGRLPGLCVEGGKAAFLVFLLG